MATQALRACRRPCFPVRPNDRRPGRVEQIGIGIESNGEAARPHDVDPPAIFGSQPNRPRQIRGVSLEFAAKWRDQSLEGAHDPGPRRRQDVVVGRDSDRTGRRREAGRGARADHDGSEDESEQSPGHVLTLEAAPVRVIR